MGIHNSRHETKVNSFPCSSIGTSLDSIDLNTAGVVDPNIWIADPCFAGLKRK